MMQQYNEAVHFTVACWTVPFLITLMETFEYPSYFSTATLKYYVQQKLYTFIYIIYAKNRLQADAATLLLHVNLSVLWHRHLKK